MSDKPSTSGPRSCEPDDLYVAYTHPDLRKLYLVLDTRDQKHFKKNHLPLSYCVRLSANGKILADYSQNEYSDKWAQDCWWGRTVFVYGDSSLRKDHPVVKFLSDSGRCTAVYYYREGFDQLQAKLPYLCTPSIKANCLRKYPSLILSGFLYLGDWAHAEDVERLDELNIRSVVTIHNNPHNLSLPARFRHLKWELPDIDTADIAPCFNKTYEFLEEARAKGHAVLVHCGAGVSRSATLVMQYLMRKNLWSASAARDHCIARRPLVCVNDGFWRTLCALEPTLGIAQRSDPRATQNFHGADAAPEALDEEAVGGKVQVRMTELGKRARGADGGGGASDAKRSKAEEGEGPTDAAAPGTLITIEVLKPEGVVGQLELGPMKAHQRVLFGRAPQGCDVVLEHMSISRQHAALAVDLAGGVTLTDLQSAHGTKLDDVWVRPNMPKQLRTGSVFSLGASTRKYKIKSIVHNKAGSKS